MARLDGSARGAARRRAVLAERPRRGRRRGRRACRHGDRGRQVVAALEGPAVDPAGRAGAEAQGVDDDLGRRATSTTSRPTPGSTPGSPDVPLVLGLLVAVPLGWLARQYRWLYTPLVVGTGLLYTIPSLALFILMPLLLGTRILDPLNVVVAMTIYTVALLVRTVADAPGVPCPTRSSPSATAMGLGPLRRLFTVELPLAVPVISAGLRVAAVSNVSIVSVAALIGVPQLGSLFTDGFQPQLPRPDRGRPRRLCPARARCSTW